MLSRVADSLYWMSRYLERAEHTARVLDVQLQLALEQPAPAGPRAGRNRWSRMLASLGIANRPDPMDDSLSVARELALHPAFRSSIVCCIVSARENARQLREQISSEMWQQLNRLYHDVRRFADDPQQVVPDELLESVKQGSHLFQGITDSTMGHGEGWQYIQLGRFIERAGAVATLLDVHFGDFAFSPGQDFEAGEHFEWIGLLKSCTAFEAYCKVYTADLSAERIAEFLLLNAEFPHAVRFSADRIQESLKALPPGSSGRHSNRTTRLAGKLSAMLSFSQTEEIMDAGLHDYLEAVKQQCGEIHTAIQQVYIDYPIESAIEV
jgi:uncharacterized alpha-E superfamily protein